MKVNGECGGFAGSGGAKLVVSILSYKTTLWTWGSDRSM